MKKGLIGRKLGMTQVFDEKGDVVAVTLIEAGPCVVVQKKELEKDGYCAVQLGFDNLKRSKVNRPLRGHFEKAGAAFKRKLCEFKFENSDSFELGALVKADMFEEGELVDVSAKSKGKGFAGVIKRFGAHRLKESHGSGPVVRNSGSMSAAATPSRILKGKKMPGRMGGKLVTVQNLTVFKIDEPNNLIVIKGAVPGPKGGYIIIKNAVKAKTSLKKETK